jgi:hypothetical protein
MVDDGFVTKLRTEARRQRESLAEGGRSLASMLARQQAIRRDNRERQRRLESTVERLEAAQAETLAAVRELQELWASAGATPAAHADAGADRRTATPAAEAAERPAADAGTERDERRAAPTPELVAAVPPASRRRRNRKAADEAGDAARPRQRPLRAPGH